MHTNSTAAIFTIKFHYLGLHFPALLLLLQNSINFKFHTSLKIVFYQFLQIPRQLIYSQIPVLTNSITCKFI